MATYDTPGAYIEREDRAQGGIARLRTDVAAFVGIAERGPARRAVAIESWKQFKAIFGGLFAHGYLAYCVKAFFDNGGRRCWVVRVEGEAASAANVTLTDDASLPVWSVQASSSGAWGNALSLRLAETRRVKLRTRLLRPEFAEVESTAGIARSGVVELIQETAGGMVRARAVVAEVDAVRQRLTWAAPPVGIASNLPARIETVSHQLQVFSNGRLWRAYEDLSLSREHPRYGPKIVNGVEPLFAADFARRETGADAFTSELVAHGRRQRGGAVPEPIRIVELRNTFGGVPALARLSTAAALTGGADGLSSLLATDFIGREGTAKLHGLAALAEIDEISMVAVPDIHVQPRIVNIVAPPRCQPDPCLPHVGSIAAPPPVAHDDLPPRFTEADVRRVMTALVEHCERHRDRVALIDPPYEAAVRTRLGVSAIRDFRRAFDSTYAALYFPWLEVRDELPQVRSPTIAIPPCGQVAGQIAATDLRVGVHKAPANVTLASAEGVTFPVDETTHGLLNSEGINVIRAQSGRGLRVAGARLVSSGAAFRFLNVRRLLLMIERSIEPSIQWAVFEGNDWLTRTKLTLCIDSFLRALWSRGALTGAAAEEAFFVRCDATNNPPELCDQGRLLIEVGVAPSVPFEFVILRIGRSGNTFELTEHAQEGV